VDKRVSLDVASLYGANSTRGSYKYGNKRSERTA
jgi:hypothetical protein